jgi:hypothetical protein
MAKMITALLFALFALAGCGGPTSSSLASPTSVPTPQTHEVVYLLDGKTGFKTEFGRPPMTADITIQTPTGTSQQQGVDVPLTSEETGRPGLEFTGFAPGAFVYVSGQISSEYGGNITCAIEVDGVRISENTASGEYAIATCQGRA